jgi:hypothetical protein
MLRARCRRLAALSAQGARAEEKPMPAKAPRRLLLSYAAPDAYASLTRPLLAKLGYRILPVEELPRLPPVMSRRRPDLRIAEESRLLELPDDPEGVRVPVVLVTNGPAPATRDPRIVAAVRRPAGIHEMYRLLQSVMEEAPRTTPRVATRLASRFRLNGREGRGSIVSLSENGCLLESAPAIPLGARIDLEFELPGGAELRTRADAAYRLAAGIGLIFNDGSPELRRLVGGFVLETLLGAA